jgi:hypothetical protein
MMKAKGKLKEWIHAEFLSPRWLLLRAALIAFGFGLCELAGLREHTTFLSGTVASMENAGHASVLGGVTYIVAYLGAVVLAPILLIAAALLALWNRWAPRRAQPSQGTA